MQYPFGTLIQACKKQVQSYPTILWLNGAAVGFFVLLTVYVKLWSDGKVIERLFSPPFNQEFPYFGMLITASNLLLCLSASICTFSVVLIKDSRSRGKINWFLAGFALILSVILLDRMFRFTVILVSLGSLLKLAMFLLYGVAAVGYASVFRHKLLSTPYAVLLGAVALLVFGAIVDLTQLDGHGLPAMLEEGSTLLAMINIAIYVWIVCRKEVLKGLWQKS
ncbi:hypothetical protein IQ268_04710 [Oculatella sp. LEGE 06141]|uniref:hypothetical protein n=1 Tax=Oculatella sp. LEGE 06141 TaxID=1828648 RepID=UPI0018824DB3|nr:hypothetical protein [Oculatella sp. LEGE 06141]MBE9177884.1 hypothetical protein [Oculatella sp. LEGE 06141]